MIESLATEVSPHQARMPDRGLRGLPREHRARRLPAILKIEAMPRTPYEEVRKIAEAMEPHDQLRLVAALALRLTGQLTPEASRSLLELRGPGKDVWQGISPEEYLTQERQSWAG